jgi:acyl-CoA thioesterase I
MNVSRHFGFGANGLRGAMVAVVMAASLGVAPAQTIVAVGPSTTAGRGVNSSDAYPARLEAMLRAKGVSATVVNAGINGEQSTQMLARLNRVVPDGTRLVILNFSLRNDSSNSSAGFWNPITREQTEKNFRDMVAAMKARGIPVVVFARQGGGYGAQFVSYADVRGPSMIQGDGLHPLPAGHERMAAKLLPIAERALRSGR